jgi:histidine phosphotransferase ChpT
MTTDVAAKPADAQFGMLDIASQLCSRLCHDLLSPVGALSNGLELLADEKDPEMRKRCMELLEQSARTSADKLKFFRLAFGAAGGFGEQVPMQEPRALIEALVRGGRLDIAAEMRGRTCEIAVRAAGPRIAFDAAVGRALAGDMTPSNLSSRTAPAAMLHQLAAGIGGELQYALTDEALVLGAMLPVG